MAVDVGLNLSPEGAAGSATAQADGFDGDVKFAEEGEGVAEAEGYSFEDGPDEVGAGVGGGDADESGAARVKYRGKIWTVDAWIVQ